MKLPASVIRWSVHRLQRLCRYGVNRWRWSAVPTLLALSIAAGTSCRPGTNDRPAESQSARPHEPLDASATSQSAEPAAAGPAETALAENDSAGAEPAGDSPPPSEQPAGDLPKDGPPQEGGSYDDRRKKIDYVDRNGAIFTDWPKPKLAVVFSADLHGYIEPCGCTGLENQKGGLSRRHTLIRDLQQRGWPIVALDAGDLVRRVGPQAAIKYQRAIEALRTIGYGVIGFGSSDLKLPSEDLLATLPQEQPAPFISANVSTVFDELGFRAPYQVIEAGGMRLGVTTVLAAAPGRKLQNADFEWVEPATALPGVLEKLSSEKCDRILLLANTSLEQARQLAARFPEIDVIAVATDSDPPAMNTIEVDGSKTRLVELGHKGMYVGVLAYFDDPADPVRYQRVPLDGRFSDSQPMQALMWRYQEQLEALGLKGLGLRPIPHPSGRAFAGTATCAECHADEYDIWKKTPHGHATETLVQLAIPRQYDPECLSCHVTGWEPQEYYPFVSGYGGLETTPLVLANGCENCHGPGSEHVAAENGDVELTDEQIEALRAEMRLTIAEARKTDCARCHDLDNSPHFDFETFWPKIKH